MFRAATITLTRAASRRLPRRVPLPLHGGIPRRRMYSQYPSGLEPRFTPYEELMLDATAWFVAFALCWSPAHEFDDLDYQNMSELQDEANSRRTHNDQMKKKQKEKEDGEHNDHHSSKGR